MKIIPVRNVPAVTIPSLVKRTAEGNEDKSRYKNAAYITELNRGFSLFFFFFSTQHVLRDRRKCSVYHRNVSHLCSVSLRYFSRSAALRRSKGFKPSLQVFTFWLSTYTSYRSFFSSKIFSVVPESKTQEQKEFDRKLFSGTVNNQNRKKKQTYKQRRRAHFPGRWCQPHWRRRRGGTRVRPRLSRGWRCLPGNSSSTLARRTGGDKLKKRGNPRHNTDWMSRATLPSPHQPHANATVQCKPKTF